MTDLAFGLRIPALHPFDLEKVSSWARGVEDAGFESVWVGDHLFTHVDVPEPLHLLHAVASVADQVRLGTAVLLANLREPHELARSAATVDLLSRGRLELGLSLGGSPAEHEAVGRRGSRAAVFLETVNTLRGLWSEPSGQGSRHEGAPAKTIRPKPFEGRAIPIYFGGRHPEMLKRAGALADGWISNAYTSLAGFVDEAEQLRSIAATHGRNPDDFRLAKLVYISVAPDRAEAYQRAKGHWDRYTGRDFDVEGLVIHGSVGECLERLSSLRALDAPSVRIVFESPSLERDDLEVLSDVCDQLRAALR